MSENINNPASHIPASHIPAPHIIVLGNEKSGGGKSTAAIEISIALLRLGYRVAVLDLDQQEQSLRRFMTARSADNAALPAPLLLSSPEALAGSACDFIIIDTGPGDSAESRAAQAQADTLITPVTGDPEMLRLLGHIAPKTGKPAGPSPYTVMIEQQSIDRILAGRPPLHWLVQHNDRASWPASAALLAEMSEMLGFGLIPGFERRALFPEAHKKGQAQFDARAGGPALSLTQLAARQEVRTLIRALAPEKLKGYRSPA